jgi:hypothetical protein
MKKVYQKPTLVQRETLGKIAATNGNGIGSLVRGSEP